MYDNGERDESDKKGGSRIVLQSQDLRVDQVKEPCIGFIQENLIESSLQSYLPYISILMVCTHYYTAYPK